MRQWSARLSLLGRFSLMSLIPIVILGVVLAQTLRSQVTARSLANARQAAQLGDPAAHDPGANHTDPEKRSNRLAGRLAARPDYVGVLRAKARRRLNCPCRRPPNTNWLSI